MPRGKKKAVGPCSEKWQKREKKRFEDVPVTKYWMEDGVLKMKQYMSSERGVTITRRKKGEIS